MVSTILEKTKQKKVIKQYCCIIRITFKKNNVFVNLTKINGQTILKFSAGLVQKKKNKKQLRYLVK
jgi:ribosomal protein S11